MDLIGSAVLGNNSSSSDSSNNNNNSNNNSDNISNSDSNNSDISNNSSNIANSSIMSDIQEDNKSTGSVKSEPTPLIDELATVSPSSSTVEQPSTTPESRIRIAAGPGVNSKSITDPSLATMEKAERPSLSYKDLIIEAIESSPEKRLKLNEIYQVIRMTHPYYRLRPDQWGWQNSIRHNLSLHDCFVKLPLKQTSASGVVGHFWTVVPELDDKQMLRRRNRVTNRSGASTSAAAAGGQFNGRLSSIDGTANGILNCAVRADTNGFTDGSGIISDDSGSTSPAHCSFDSTYSSSNEFRASVTDSLLISTQSVFKPQPCTPTLSHHLSKSTLAEAAAAILGAAFDSLSFTSDDYKYYAQNLLNAYFYQQSLLTSLQQLAEVANRVNPIAATLPASLLGAKMPLLTGLFSNSALVSFQMPIISVATAAAIKAAAFGVSPLLPLSLSGAAATTAATTNNPFLDSELILGTPKMSISPTSTQQQLSSSGSLSFPIKSEAQSAFMFS
uniref:Fork head domain containing protein n=1 Tax=Brugia malayi TaxID=6279 RepID=A0A7I4NNG4_BRUMA